MNDPLPPQERSVAARRTRVLARMATSRTALMAKNQAKSDSEAPSSAQLRTAVDAQFIDQGARPRPCVEGDWRFLRSAW